MLIVSRCNSGKAGGQRKLEQRSDDVEEHFAPNVMEGKAKLETMAGCL